MKVQVTEKHIARGIVGNGSKCPVALAMKDATGKDWLIASTVCLSAGEQRSLPQAARDFIIKFDNGLSVEPFTIEWGKELSCRWPHF